MSHRRSTRAADELVARQQLNRAHREVLQIKSTISVRTSDCGAYEEALRRAFMRRRYEAL